MAARQREDDEMRKKTEEEEGTEIRKDGLLCSVTQ